MSREKCRPAGHQSGRWSNYRRAARHVLKRWGFKSWAVTAAGRVYKTLEYVGKGPVHSKKHKIITGPPCSCQILLRSPFFDRGSYIRKFEEVNLHHPVAPWNSWKLLLKPQAMEPQPSPVGRPKKGKWRGNSTSSNGRRAQIQNSPRHQKWGLRVADVFVLLHARVIYPINWAWHFWVWEFLFISICVGKFLDATGYRFT